MKRVFGILGVIGLAAAVGAACSGASPDGAGGGLGSGGAGGGGAGGDGCPDGQKSCDGTCTRVDIDAAHCGACSNACAEGELCQDGACGLDCSGGTTKCGDACVDTAGDRDHCGDCDQACLEGEVCSGGKCGLECSGGTTKCGDRCIDTDIDPAHCGDCGQACAEGELCSGGTCGLECSGGTTKCGDRCVDTENDSAHCGECDQACPIDQTCDAGKCQELAPLGSCLEILENGRSTGDGVYTLRSDSGEHIEAYCDMSTDGGGWTLLAKIDGGAGEGWKFDAAHWKNGAATGGDCVLDPTTGCDGKSAAWGWIVLKQLQVDTGEDVALYDLIDKTKTMATHLSAVNINTKNNAKVIANRYGGTQDANYDVVSLGDSDFSNHTESGADRCVLQVRKGNVAAYNAGGFCAGRVRGVSSNSFVYYPTDVTTSRRADYARMHDGTSATLDATMLIYGR